MAWKLWHITFSTRRALPLCTLEVGDDVNVNQDGLIINAFSQSGGMPDLKRLRLECRSVKVLRELGHIYAAGGLDGLTDIEISSHEWYHNDRHSRFWMHAVARSEHKGASVERLRIGWVTPDITYEKGARKYRPLMVETENNRDSHAYRTFDSIIDGLREGAFPCLQCLDINIAEPSIDDGQEIGQFLIHALKGGAPCARTLRVVDLHGMSEKHAQEVKALLSEGAIVC